VTLETVHYENRPETLDGGDIAEYIGQWWAAQPLGNQEEVALKLFQMGPDGKGIKYYRPLRIEGYDTHHRLGKPPVRLPKYRPLFKGYLFFCGDITDRIWVRDIHKFAKIIDIPNQQRFVQQIIQVRDAQQKNPHLGMEPAPKLGTRMRVLSGDWEGKEGVLVRVGKHKKFYILIDVLSQAAELEIDAARLEPI
jgi:transcription antitermination factor NusG